MRATVPGLPAALVLAIATSGCASVPRGECAGATASWVQDTLYFGTARPVGFVTPGEWARFLEATVTPRFPEGLTVWDATGQWRGADGVVVREPSHVLTLLHADDAGSERRVLEIVAAYKARFEQEAVLRVRSDVCPSF